MIPPGTDVGPIDAGETLNEILGGVSEPSKFDIEKIFYKSSWKCDLAVADSFRSAAGKVFLAGDAGRSSPYYYLSR
jgi:hypothetical protein